MRRIALAAAAWKDPSHVLRRAAVEKTLLCENAFTPEAVEFALDQQLSLVTASALESWIDGRRSQAPRRVAVLNAGNIPFVGLNDMLATILTGNEYVGVLSSRSPHLLPAFLRTADLGDIGSFADLEEALHSSEAVIATGSDETMALVSEQAARNGIEASKTLLRGSGFGAAILTGSESRDELLDLAEDCLLHEGRGCRNVAVVWAPERMAPDLFFDSAATFRGVFPAHERTPAALRMPKAMLEALEVPCAYAEDLSFLVSRAGPEAREPCHVRWVTYTKVEEAIGWCRGIATSLRFVATNSSTHRDALAPFLSTGNLGTAQRPELGWYSGDFDPVDFLSSPT